MADHIKVANGGEHLVAAYLLAHGFHVFVADRNNRAFDLCVFHNGKFSLLRVKTSSRDRAPWSAKADGNIFRELQQKNDYGVIVLNFGNDITSTDFYFIPTTELNSALQGNHEEWMKTPKRDGGRHKDSTLRQIIFSGKRKGHAVSRGWDKYKNELGLKQLQGKSS